MLRRKAAARTRTTGRASSAATRTPSKWFFALPADPQECLTPFVNYTWWCSGTPDKTDNYANEVKPANGRSDHNRHACVRKRQADPRSTHAWMLTE